MNPAVQEIIYPEVSFSWDKRLVTPLKLINKKHHSKCIFIRIVNKYNNKLFFSCMLVTTCAGHCITYIPTYVSNIFTFGSIMQKLLHISDKIRRLLHNLHPHMSLLDSFDCIMQKVLHISDKYGVARYAYRIVWFIPNGSDHHYPLGVGTLELTGHCVCNYFVVWNTLGKGSDLISS